MVPSACGAGMPKEIEGYPNMSVDLIEDFTPHNMPGAFIRFEIDGNQCDLELGVAEVFANSIQQMIRGAREQGSNA